MLEKNVRLLILPLLLSAALSFAACSSLSEDIPSDTSTPLLISGEPSEESEKISESEQQSASEETKRTSAEEITTPHEGEPGTARQETRQSSPIRLRIFPIPLWVKNRRKPTELRIRSLSPKMPKILRPNLLTSRIRNPLHRLFRQRRLCPKPRPLPKRQPCRKPIRP